MQAVCIASMFCSGGANSQNLSETTLLRGQIARGDSQDQLVNLATTGATNATVHESRRVRPLDVKRCILSRRVAGVSATPACRARKCFVVVWTVARRLMLLGIDFGMSPNCH